MEVHPGIVFGTSRNFKIYFSGSEYIYTYKPKWISGEAISALG
jgi:hypothetical protein